MKARELWFSQPGQLEIREQILPEPGEDESLILTELCGISAGTERLLWKGQFPDEIVLDEGIASLNRPSGYPCPYGYNLIGRINGKEGLYLAFHPHCDAAVVKTKSLIALPPAWPAELAVLLPNAETALNLLLDAAPRAGDRIVVFGLGIVGLLLSSMLARFPLESITVIEPDAARRNRAGNLPGITTLSPDDASDVHESCADMVFELSGNPQALQQAINLAGYASKIVVGSWYGSKTVSLDLGSRFHRKRLEIVSSQVSTIAPELRGRWTHQRRMNFAIQLLDSIGSPDWATHRFPLDNAEEAYRLIDGTKKDWLQVVLEP